MYLIKQRIIFYFLPIIVVGSILCLLYIPILLLPFSILLIAITAYLVVLFNLQVAFVKTLAFLLPFSIELPFIDNSMIFIPTEPLIAILAFVIFFEFIIHPIQFISRIYKELLWAIPLVLAFVVSIPFSGNLGISLKFSLVNLIYILVFYLYFIKLFTTDPKLFFTLIVVYGLGFFLVTLWAIYQYWEFDWNPVVVRGIFRPFYKDHTIYSAVAALLGGFWFVYSIMSQGRTKLLSIGLCIFFFICVVLSKSRAGFLSILFSISIFIILWLRIRFLYLVITLAIISSVGFIFKRDIVTRMKNITQISSYSQAGIIDRTISSANIYTDVSNIERLNRWSAALRMFKEKPLTGFGSGTFQFVYIPYQDKRLENRLTVKNPWDIPENSGGTAHSEYLLAISEMGILGLIGWVALVVRWIFIVFTVSYGSALRRNILIAFVALSTYLFHGIFNNFLNTDKVAFLFWATAAWLAANYKLSNEQ